ncbi:nickel-type superoxide dismutase maturation protease [Roseofilum casamattae]|uniref:Nickel-type superoxide dismutase maturation protease n=1 Tax=Roseofilum casamattae BLCC-M143 TaxID=3022442 RepID=A0ABT7BZT2_9CYAN|nr:nickel-type superoxide dismutase maturation protease [Roseofilum casamattae]MDJ1184312.1 nickel-type superoxide dismutase maturation protease [Roseofilum casamattae BLCC-M143]
MMSSIRSSTIWDILLWLGRQRQRFRVSGVSMLPTLQPGDEVLVDRRAYWRSPPAIDDIVILQTPDRQDLWSIKRVTAVNPDGSCFVRGDNRAHSTDSRSFGWVPPTLLLGRVTSHFL